MKRILRFGVVGCGRIAGNHLRALVSDQVPAELVAVVDVKEDRAREKAEQYRVPYYLDYHDMLTRHPDIVILGGNAVNRIEHWQFDPERPEDAQVRAAASQDVPDVYGHGHGDYLAAVVRSILSNQSGMVEGAEGRKNVVILTALYESAARGGLPVRPGVRIRKARIGRRSPGRTTPALGGRGTA